MNSIWAALWQNQQSECAPSEDSDQPGHPPSLIRVFAVRMKKAWTLSYSFSAQEGLWWSESSLGAQPHCWFCHETARFYLCILCRFLTQRQHRLIDRRKNAEELLKWKELLDSEENRVLNLEKKALKVWDQKEKDKSTTKQLASKKEETEPKLSSKNGTAKGKVIGILFVIVNNVYT